MTRKDTSELGFHPDRLDHVVHLLDDDIEHHRYDGAALCVTRGGQVALSATRGFADRDVGKRLE